jgi:hypothetical protein
MKKKGKRKNEAVRTARIGIGTRRSSSLKGALLSNTRPYYRGREIRGEKKEKEKRKSTVSRDGES